MKRKILAVVLTFVLSIFMFQSISFAQDEISVVYEGQKIEFDVQPQIISDRTMVPMRKIFEALGASVNWIDEEKCIIATKGSKILTMKIGEPQLTMTDVLSDETNIAILDSAPVIIDGRTLVPVRAISESFGIEVSWDSETRTVTLGQ